jgi:putative ABC transport system substrate-binding protein
MTGRRRLLAAAFLLFLLTPWPGGAQSPGKVHRIGVLANGSAAPKMPEPVEALREALAGLGYVEGRTLEIEYRWAEGRSEQLPALAADLVRAQVELIVAAGDAPTRAAMAATRSLPIVMATSGDAVGAAFVASLARPGGNVTGMTAINPELAGKRLQLLRELVPRLTRVVVLWNPEDLAHALDLRASQSAALQLGVVVQPVALRSAAEVEAAFERIVRDKADAIVVFNDTTTIAARQRILQLAAQQRIAAMYEAREWVSAGGLVAYGVAHADLFRQSAFFVDKILKGAKPGDLPVEQPTRLRLTLNPGAAKALGMAIPQSLLLRADEVIE